MVRVDIDHRIRFGPILARNIIEQKMRIAENKPSIIVIDGPLGSGKTTLATEIADFFQIKPINISEQVAMGGSDFTSKLRTCIDKQHKVLIYDESGDFSRKNTMSTFNKNLTRIFDTFRTYRMLLILVLPSALKLDGHILDTKALRMLIHCEERSKTCGTYMLFSLVDFEWILYHQKRLPIKGQAYSKQYPVCVENFLALLKDRQLELDALSQKAKEGILDDLILRQKGFVTARDIASQTGYSVRQILNKLKQFNYTPQTRVSNADYYDGRALAHISNALKRKKKDLKLQGET